MAAPVKDGEILEDYKGITHNLSTLSTKCFVPTIEYQSNYPKNIGTARLNYWPTVRNLPLHAIPTLHLNNYLTPNEIDNLNHLSSAFRPEEIEINISDVQFFQEKQTVQAGIVIEETLPTTTKLKLNVYFDELGLFDGEYGMYVFNCRNYIPGPPSASFKGARNKRVKFDVGAGTRQTRQEWPDDNAAKATIWDYDYASEGFIATKPTGYDIGHLHEEWGIREETDIPWAEMGVGESKTFHWKISDPKWRPTRPRAKTMGLSTYHANPGFWAKENCPDDNNALIHLHDQVTYSQGWKLLKKPIFNWNKPVRLMYPQPWFRQNSGSHHVIHNFIPQQDNGGRSAKYAANPSFHPDSPANIELKGTYIGIPTVATDIKQPSATETGSGPTMNTAPVYLTLEGNNQARRPFIRDQQFTQEDIDGEANSAPVNGPKLPDTLLQGYMYNSPTYATYNIQQSGAAKFDAQNPVKSYTYNRLYEANVDIEPTGHGADNTNRTGFDQKGIYCENHFWEWLGYNPTPSTFNQRDIPTLLVKVPRIYNAQNAAQKFYATFQITYKMKYSVKGGTKNKFFFPTGGSEKIEDLQMHGVVDYKAHKLMQPDKFVGKNMLEDGLIKATKPWGYQMDGNGAKLIGPFYGVPNENDDL